HCNLMFFRDADGVTTFGADFVERLDAVTEAHGNAAQALMRMRVEYFTRIHAISQFRCWNQAFIGGDTLVRAEATTLLYQAGDEGIERAPGDRARGTAVDALHVGVARTQSRDIDTDTAAA